MYFENRRLIAMACGVKILYWKSFFEFFHYFFISADVSKSLNNVKLSCKLSSNGRLKIIFSKKLFHPFFGIFLILSGFFPNEVYFQNSGSVLKRCTSGSWRGGKSKRKRKVYGKNWEYCWINKRHPTMCMRTGKK